MNIANMLSITKTLFPTKYLKIEILKIKKNIYWTKVETIFSVVVLYL